jgi:hypothetical protein
MAARPRGRTTIALQRIIRAKFDTEKRFWIQINSTRMFLLQLEKNNDAFGSKKTNSHHYCFSSGSHTLSLAAEVRFSKPQDNSVGSGQVESVG